MCVLHSVSPSEDESLLLDGSGKTMVIENGYHVSSNTNKSVTKSKEGWLEISKLSYTKKYILQILKKASLLGKNGVCVSMESKGEKCEFVNENAMIVKRICKLKNAEPFFYLLCTLICQIISE